MVCGLDVLVVLVRLPHLRQRPHRGAEADRARQRVVVDMPQHLLDRRHRHPADLDHRAVTASPRTYYVVQYWESKEKLHAYAHASDAPHRRAWAIYNRTEKAGKIRQHVGLWHEAYVVPEGSYESIYADMPAFGLAAAHGQVPVEKRGRYAKDRFAHRSARAKAAEKAR
ncbi:hypothetical protein ACM01_09205 [Streptomyces viridochromogenes]|uniref:DUF4188 domain-containing protein n=1 Tax=Streptomyces viridochromogenes TaxID=1938 RepID=A0A0J7ZKH8_STRVR|nr:DUF4188 domain-containing protein [Streptomyces viridochromogenes]KMS75643.1 hypothetical protein ACM01_09205 [Streptomyces viridochromogenes]